MVFLENNTDPPWLCIECGSAVTLKQLLVHHLDENHFNDDPSNLAPVHRSCHASIHQRGKPSHMKGRTQTPHQKQVAARTSHERIWSMDSRQKVGDALRGRVGHLQTTETRKTIGQASIDRESYRKPTCQRWYINRGKECVCGLH